MWRGFSLFVVCVVCVFSVKAQTLNETESSLILNNTTADFSMVVDNPDKPLDGKIQLEIVDEKDSVRANISQNLKIKNGKETYKITMPVGDLIQKASDQIAWYRLRYQIGERSGVVSLSQILRDVFELRVIATDNLLTGMTYRSRVHAANPFTNQPVAGVTVTAEVNLDLKGDEEKKLKITSSGETDAQGFVILDFQIPIEANLADGKFLITGRKNGIVREADEELRTLGDDFRFPMMTDKPIYQPEQTLSVRGILFKGMEETAVVSGNEVEFRVEDEENTVLYREKVKTSEFGVAAMAWKIPANAKLGTYRIRVKTQTAEDGQDIGQQRVKISRYDLPNFAVAAKALKPYYLPNDVQAEVEVRADYLFGKPVTKGRVRVVQENERQWNYQEQKYDIEEGESHEGATDAEGKFTAKFDLKEAQEDLKDSGWQKFRDLNFTAYFTDLTTNKTEQRRFDVRLTKEPIHVYFIGDRDDANPKMPVNGYVSTFYADGTPAACDVEIKGRQEDSDEKYQSLQKLRTNSYGAGKIKFMRPKFENATDDLEIEIIAKDKNGLKGAIGGEDYDRYDNEISFDKDDILQITTEKSIYKPGESVKISLTSTKQTGVVYVDIVKGWSVVASGFINLEGGKADLKIPYQSNFQGELKVAAYTEEEDDDDSFIKTSRGIIFPTPQNLRLAANFDKATYKPSEEARVKFGVLDSIGKAVESVLGVVIFDKAIEERARADSEFSGTFSDYSGWLGYGENFAGVNVKDLNDLDLSKPIPQELQLVAEVMFYDEYYEPNVFHSSGSYYLSPKVVYANYFKKQFEPIETMLSARYAKNNYEHPQDEASFRRLLAANGFNFDSLRDPWDQPYRITFDVEKSLDVLRVMCAGADKTFDTQDDFSVLNLSFLYFPPTGAAIDKAVEDFHKRTGGYIRDEKTLFQELGISELKDRFGRPYRITFEVHQRYYVIHFFSLGKNGVYNQYSWQDDFDVWANKIDYFTETETKVQKMLQTADSFPKDENEFRSILKANDVDFEQIRDGYGEQVYLVKKQFSRYTNKVRTETVQKFGDPKVIEQKTVTPVTQEIITFEIRGKGADKKENTPDDFTLAEFLHVISEQTKDEPKPQKPNFPKIAFVNGTGSISGSIIDANGATVPGATVIATDEVSAQSQKATSDEEGKYLIANLAPGNYTVRVEASGFKVSVIQKVSVTANNITKADITLSLGAVAETVEVSAGPPKIATTVSSQKIENLPKGKSLSNLVELKPGISNPKENTDNQTSSKSTPKLREYFPETLLWNPELVTAKDGTAELKFKMADNITTWKLYTIASTRNGKVGVAEKEFTAFQPFFVDLEPPKFLTDGDEIYLPTQVRNYTKDKQKVDVTMLKSDWFSFLNADRQQIEVAPGSAQNAVFGFKAITPVKDGKQKVTALAPRDSDAIEKPVTVRPNGEEIVRTESKLFTDSTNFEADFPANALPKTRKSELKIYPNLMAHVTESVEGLLKRPYGCGEQTISSTYPNLMILKFTKTSPLTPTAQKYLQSGYERLLGYQMADGGFSYWGGKDSADIALTAYALRFLNDARVFIKVDEKVIEKAENYLIKQQQTDGRWMKQYSWEKTEDTRRTKMLTSYVTKTLAALETDKAVLDKALSYLKTRNEEIDEPYSLALYAIASFDAGDIENAARTVKRLSAMAKNEGQAAYWNLESNTPFYGWGTAGRIETTALVVQALIRDTEKNKDSLPQTTDLISKGMMFLLKNKDRYGVWYSTQTTVNVLDTFLASLKPAKNQTITVSLNGEKLKELIVPDDQIEPVILDLTGKISSANQVEIKSSENTSVMAQIVNSHYIDWKDSASSNRNINDSRQIRLDYKCDKSNVKIMETVTCSVEAERIGFQGYGMLLAEIGLPPGADVSRESLEKAFENDWSLSRYDVLPDRIVVYMWARAGGSKFNFSFKPRYGISAQTPASVIYDYYNEEAQATLTPLKFNVK